MAIGTAAAILGGAAISGIAGASASRSAARAQQQAADAATAEQQRQFDIAREDSQPWRQAGVNALASLQNPSAFQQSPGYEFQRTEGMRGIGNSFAARGGAASGNALKALAQFNQGLAQQDYGNWWNRQAGLAGVGQAAQQNINALGAQTAGNVGNLQMASGEARASGILGQANSLGNSINSGINNYLTFGGGSNQIWNRQTGQANDGLGYYFAQSQRR